MKAIETHYRGYRFRSRLESRWAVFFDSLGIRWEYEIEGFDLDGTRYLPDFWLPEQKYWIEIKGHEPTEMDNEKCWKLAEKDQENTVFLFGNIPGINEREDIGCKYKATFDNGQVQRSIEPNQMWTQCLFCRRWEIADEGYLEPFKCKCIDRYYNMDNIVEWLRDSTDPENLTFNKLFYSQNNPLIASAYTAARQARFEFGENGN
jgi:hypothetical protein